MALQSLSRDDLRAAVGAGVLTEAQAAHLLALGEARLGQRAAMAEEDEPFELFRGFAEIFVSIGLILLLSGLCVLGSVLQGVVLPAGIAVMCWLLGLYFTRRRRMALPSIVLVTGFAIGAAGTIGYGLMAIWADATPPRGVFAVYALMMLAALALHFRRFKVPFTALLGGLALAGLMFALVDMVLPFGAFPDSFSALFDLRHGSTLPLATLITGLLALAAGLYCDMRDPYRLGRWSATGFWCHMLAAPALVNTIALTAYNAGGLAGNLLLALALVLVALLALVIDRRSFLTAGIAYLGILLAWVLRGDGGDTSIAALMILLGALLTAMGTWWTAMRSRLMRALPDFPGKDRLPPWA